MRLKKLIEVHPSIVNLDEIDCSPGPFCMSFAFDPGELARSIERVGMVNAPVVRENSGQRMTLVSGFRRVKAADLLKWDRLPCRILSASDASPLQCLLLNFHENLATREFNNVERAMILTRMDRVIPREEILAHYMPLLGLSAREETFHFYRAIERETDMELKASIAGKRISLPVTRWLMDMEQPLRSQVFGLMNNLRFNINQQKQFIEYIIDLSKRDEKSVSGLLKDPRIETLCSDRRMNNPQKARAVLRYLREIRFPELSKAEETFRSTIAALALPKGARVEAPPFFEAPLYRLEVLFKSGKELTEKLTRLTGLEGLERIGDPWEEVA
jgi:ParB-like nuclease family protein